MSEEQPILVQTKDFALTPERLREISYLLRFNTKEPKSLISTGVVFNVMTPFTISLIFHGTLTACAIGFVIALVLYTLGVFYPLFAIRREAASPENRNFFQSRHYEFDNEIMHVYLHDGTSGTSRLENLIKVIKTEEYFLLYASQHIFHYLPFDAFETDDDLNQLERLFQAHNTPVRYKAEPIQRSFYARRK